MRQSFDVTGGATQARTNLPRLRDAMKAAGLDGVYIPHEDEYQNEYLPAANERLAWVTGFTGSAGAAIVLSDRAAVFVDGRYTLQAEDQVPGELFERLGLPDPGPFGWLADQSLQGLTLGYDPRLVSPNEARRLAEAAERAGARLKALDENPIDRAWTERPPQPLSPVIPHPLTHSGRESTDKRREIADGLARRGADATVLTSPASLAWLFNIRGGDVARSPLPLGRAILRRDTTATLFLDPRKTTDGLAAHLGETVELRPLEALEDALAELGGQTVSLDPDLASAWFFDRLEAAGATLLREPDPVALPRACKNATEIAGTVAAHRRDGVAVTRFLHWLATEAQSGKVTEIDAALALEGFRDALDGVQDLSFDTISGAGPNGALPHYRVSTASNRRLAAGTLYLVDSGAQYLDGTTDVTRTVAIGPPSRDMQRHYTLVLKGHIALATVRFPSGITGTHLDPLARQFLWADGLDYDHGTGHGVGVYLGVHEGPQRISKGWSPTALRPGMIVSNEPGYYRVGAYGIRIENLQYVTEPETPDGGDRPMLGFEPLTLAPLARDLIDANLLTPSERAWIDAYHARVWREIGPQLEGAARAWTEMACKPL